MNLKFSLKNISCDRESRPRAGRQSPEPPDDLLTGNCETTGYETRVRQDCQVVTENVCTNVTVTRFNKKIERNCTTRVGERLRGSLM